jgi:hypothetical protein
MEKYLESHICAGDLKNTIIKMCNRRDHLLTYRLIYQDSNFYKQTIYKKNEESSLIPIHTKGPMSDTTKYGGYMSLTTSHFVVAEIRGKKVSKTLLSVPLLYTKIYKGQELIDKLIELVPHKKGEQVSIDINRKIQLNQKVFVEGCNYLLMSSDEKQIKLKPATPIYLDFVCQLYINKANKNIDKIKECESDYLELIENREGTSVSIFSKDKNLEIFRKLKTLASHKKYDYCPIINQIRGMEESFIDKNLYEQICMINNLILLFGRVSDKSVFKGRFRKSKAFISETKCYLVFESITGLISYKKAI